MSETVNAILNFRMWPAFIIGMGIIIWQLDKIIGLLKEKK